ncbi:hypothetical protein CHLRE_09g391245v5 [Chlamydomonas reinhardtii]|uniref:Protein kinase domain-containing protein n=1 Tax=Chlamydomonas reinhardtii TaxID=3055 RepID=A0A2K3DE59_CHLRE|nr:uncharacterized protein CHLRE_09g391245v5 [Chlamydomonas reinhardtii]PNW78821.1 hypothetical protein CHLRE_09g391245v5 [Chlamydomonas reinhardtii]
MAHAPSAARRIIGNWEITEVLGSGSFAIVWKARHTTTGTLAAVKEVLTDRLNKKLLESLESEIATLQRLKHANIVGLLDLFKEPGKIFLVLEYCGGGDLAQYLRHRGPLSEASCRYLLRHLAEGLKVLRAHNIIHRDLKPQNLLLSDSGPSPTLKIADFGFARSLQPAGMAETLCGSPLYMAPEVLQLARYDAKADLWSVGTILFELLAGRPPFQGANHLQLVQNIERGDAVLPDAVARALTPGCRQLLYQLLRRNPVERISHDELFAHPFLQGEAASAAVQLPAPIAAAVAALAAQEPLVPPGPLQPPAAQHRHMPVSQGAVRFITPAGRDRSPVHPLLRPTPGTSPNTSTSPPAPGAAAINVSKSQESAAPIQHHHKQQPSQAAAAPQAAGGVAATGVGVGVGGVGVVAPAPSRVAAATAAGTAPAIAVREVIHRSPSPHVAATTAAVESVFMEGAAAAAHAAATATRAAAAGGGGGDALAESSDSDYVVVSSPSATPRQQQHQQPAQLLSPRTQHPAIANSGANSRSNSGGGAPPSPTTAHPAATAAAGAAKQPTSQQPAAPWQQALPPIAAATLPHSAQPAHTAQPAGTAGTFTMRMPGAQPASGLNGGGAVVGSGAGGGDGDVALLPRVISLLLDHAKARCTSLLDQEAEARQFGVGASGLGGWDGAGLAGTEEGAGMAEEAAEAVGTLLVAVRLLAAALSSRSAAAAPPAAAGSGGGAAGEPVVSSGVAAAPEAAATGANMVSSPQPVAAALPAQASSPFATAATPPARNTTEDDATAAAGAAPADSTCGRLATATSLRSLAVQARDALALMDEHMHGTVAQLLLGGADVAAAAAATSASASPAARPPAAAAATAPPPSQLLVPCALDALMATAVRHSRAAAGEELLGHAAGAAEHYGAAADVLAFLLAAPLPPGGAAASQLRHPASVVARGGAGGGGNNGEEDVALTDSELLMQSVRPPLAPHDRQRLAKYYAAVKVRQSAAAAAAAATGAGAGNPQNHYSNTNNYFAAGGPKGALPQPHGTAAAVAGGVPAAGVYGMYGNRHQGAVVY